MSYDILIKDAKVVDGSGMPAYRADVGISGGRIAEIGRLSQPATRTIHADGLVLAPGFIDHHTHLDAHLTWDPLALSSPEHGVTTVITGNCGLSMMPCKPEHRSAIIGTFVLVEQVPRDILESVEWSWTSVGEYLDVLDQRLGVNVACHVGHNAVRQWVMGDDATERTATAEEVAAMQDMVRQAMREGAIGLSFNRNPTQFRDDGKPLPGHLADENEMVALSSVLSEFNAGVLQHGPMGKHKIENIDWFARLSQVSGRPILWHTLGWRADDPDLWRHQLEHVAGYFAKGLPVYGNMEAGVNPAAVDQDAVAEVMRSPYANIGMSDAGAHVGRTAKYGLSSTVLGYWVREREVMSLEEAVKRLTFKIASIFGIKDRGLVWPGWAADLVLLDPSTVEAMEAEPADDYPGGTRRMVQHAKGVYCTIVNGQVLIEEGKATGALPGRVIRNAWAERNA